VSRDHWAAVDRYLAAQLLPPDPSLDAALARSADAGLPPAAVSAAQGKLLHLLARLRDARRILELGTLGGYSTIWLARALPPDGRLVTLEAQPGYAEVARANVDAAGLGDVVEIVVGPALETLPRLAANGEPAFDLVFLDADKRSNAEYLAWALRLSRPGTLIVADNVVRAGAVAEPSDDESVAGVRRFFAAVAAEPRLSGTAIQTVGSKGYDGFALLLVQ
jgi:predicted O-methyltransferase YrrM